MMRYRGQLSMAAIPRFCIVFLYGFLHCTDKKLLSTGKNTENYWSSSFLCVSDVAISSIKLRQKPYFPGLL